MRLHEALDQESSSGGWIIYRLGNEDRQYKLIVTSGGPLVTNERYFGHKYAGQWSSWYNFSGFTVADVLAEDWVAEKP